MPVQKGVLPDNLFLNVTIDGNEFPFVTEINIKHEVNNARSVVCKIDSRIALEACRIGSKVELSYHKNSVGSSFDDARSFLGIIKSISPKENESTFTAIDYITFLAESEFVFYKPQDYIGEDLYFAAAKACDYRGIDVSRLTSGSGLFITEDMDLFGWKTRKEFIDACFNEMRVLVDDGQHSPNTIKQWYYAIRKDNIMDFFFPDPQLEGAFEYLTISENNNNITQDGIISKIDTTQMINAVTVISNSDETIYAQLKDEGSIDKHGVVSKFIVYNSSNKNELENVAYIILNRFNKPSVYYNIVTHNTDDVSLGDLIKVEVPSTHAALYASNDILTLIGYEITIGQSIRTRLKIGEKPLTIQDEIEIISKPTNR